MGPELHLMKAGGKKQQSNSGHGNSWLYSYFHLLIKETLTAANTNRVRALAECTGPEGVHRRVWERQQPPAKPDFPTGTCFCLVWRRVQKGGGKNHPFQKSLFSNFSLLHTLTRQSTTGYKGAKRGTSTPGNFPV